MESSLVADLWWTVQFDILFTFSQLLNLHPYCRIRATKCMQRTIALYQYKLLNLFPFSEIEFCKVVMFKPWTSSQVCITVSNSPNPSSVYIRLFKHRKKVFYCLNIAFFRKILLLCRLQAIYLLTFSFTVHKEMYRIYAN